MRSRKQQQKYAEREAAAWKHPPGTTITYYPVLGDKSNGVDTTTTSSAAVLGGHTAVVGVEGVGMVAVSNCEYRK